MKQKAPNPLRHKSQSENNPVKLERLSKILAHRGVCSRREAEVLIAKGWVKVNGEVISTQGVKFPVECDIEIAPQAKESLKAQLTIALNKPIGYVSTQPEKSYREALELITLKNRDPKDNQNPLKLSQKDLKGLSVVGRLDIDSKGLLLFTQSGKLAKAIIGPQSEVEKEYLVRVEGAITEAKLKKLRQGLTLDSKPLKRAKICQLEDQVLQFILKEGKKRQIRRMCELVDLKVTSLKRVRIGNLSLGPLPSGRWRVISDTQSIIKTTTKKKAR
jgi:23S rRNA pseudouridine2604 synthase